RPPRQPNPRKCIPAQAVTQIDRVSAAVRRLAAELDGAHVLPFRKAIQPGASNFLDVAPSYRVRPTIELSMKSPGPFYSPAAELFVATPATLRYLGIDPETIDPGTDFLAAPEGQGDKLVILHDQLRLR